MSARKGRRPQKAGPHRRYSMFPLETIQDMNEAAIARAREALPPSQARVLVGYPPQVEDALNRLLAKGVTLTHLIMSANQNDPGYNAEIYLVVVYKEAAV
jgi:alkanesulfonate monooxygenase SsuD/methylene tetrahydromethanopterin reductase-like flavin-dependent oxidoreductase (luciferase family)